MGQKFRKRCQRCWPPVKRWWVNYGFALLVLVAFAGGAIATSKVDVPEELPSLAFNSELLYRLEIGGFTFFFGYLAVLAFVLALNGRGFSHIGPKGLKAEEVVNRTIHNQEQNIAALERGVKRNRAVGELHNEAIKGLDGKASGLQKADEEISASLHAQREALAEMRERLERLEEKLR